MKAIKRARTERKNMSIMTPREIVSQLDRHIIGQDEAKRAVSIALRNRWRRQQVDEALQAEIMPKNILLIGPTGVGKTEIARRLAKLVHAPFIKVEATKFTQIGYVGKDVDSIVRDLVLISQTQTREKAIEEAQPKAELAAEEALLDLLLPPITTTSVTDDLDSHEKSRKTREKLRIQLRNNALDDKLIEIQSDVTPKIQLQGAPGMEDMAEQLQEMFGQMKSKKKTRKVKVKDAWKILIDQEAARLIDEEEIRLEAVRNAEQNGIIFIDEFDKITRNSNNNHNGDVSHEGVQRDLLPLIEGCTVNTKLGNIKTDHMLFIASGAFHNSKPSDLIAEIQGRLPIRVELKTLSIDDFEKILKEPKHSLPEQYSALLGADGVKLQWRPEGIRRLAEIAWEINDRQENIGARRLHTVLERLLNNISFAAPDHQQPELVIDEAMANEQLESLAKDVDLSHYIL